jgi:hypothetical protein
MAAWLYRRSDALYRFEAHALKLQDIVKMDNPQVITSHSPYWPLWIRVSSLLCWAFFASAIIALVFGSALSAALMLFAFAFGYFAYQAMEVFEQSSAKWL